MPNCALSILCPSTVEERLLDALVVIDGIDVFTTTPTYVHGLQQRATAMEQVTGRRRAVLVHVLLSEAVLEGLHEALRRDFAGSGLRYWNAPVMDAEDLA